MLKPSVQLEQQENLSQSRILFEQVMVDNEPTQQQILQRAEQLQIDDLVLAKQSLTKQLESYWRPYMNRYGDIYYINLKQKKAYVDHPIDMETKILYAKRHKSTLPKFRSYQFQDVSGSIPLIEQEIKKWQRADLLRSTQTIPSQLNIVYEESDQSQTQRQKSLQDQFSQDEYIENLQKSQQQNTRSNKTTPRQRKQSFSKDYKRFPVDQDDINENMIIDDNEDGQDSSQLSPQYQRLLLQYEQQLKRQHSKQLRVYRQKKQQNYLIKQQIIREDIKARQEQYKHKRWQQFESEIQQKNSINYEKQKLKLYIEYRQKIKDVQSSLQKQYEILVKLQQNREQKQQFIKSLQYRMQKSVNQNKYIKSQRINKQMYQDYLNEIGRQNKKFEQQYERNVYKIVNKKGNQIISNKGVRQYETNELIKASSLTQFYQGIVKKQFNKIDKLLLQNQISKQIRKRSKYIFNHNNYNKNNNLNYNKHNQINKNNNQNDNKHNQINNYNKQNQINKKYQQNIYQQNKYNQSHIIFNNEQKLKQIKLKQQIQLKQKQPIQFKQKSRIQLKQNNINISNMYSQQKQNIANNIQTNIQKFKQTNNNYYQRRNKIFKSQSQYSHLIHTNNQQPTFNQSTHSNHTLQINIQNINYSSQLIIQPKLDRKSMYLRMMKRIL